MTNEKAIEVLKTENCFECAYGAVSSYECDCKDCELQRAAKMGVEALEKQIPKKPNKEVDYSWGKATDVNVCPACGYYLSNYEWIETEYGKKEKVTYCDTCGQALDWNE